MNQMRPTNSDQFCIGNSLTFRCTILVLSLAGVNHVVKGFPSSCWPFVVTEFENEEKGGKIHNGFEISMYADVREVFPAESMSHLFPHDAYVVDGNKMIAILPALSYAYIQDETEYLDAEANMNEECSMAAKKRNEMGNGLMAAKKHELNNVQRVLFYFPEGTTISNEVYGDNEHRRKIKTVKIPYQKQHDMDGGGMKLELTKARVLWRVTIETDKDRLAQRKKTSNNNVDLLSKAFGKMSTTTTNSG